MELKHHSTDGEISLRHSDDQAVLMNRFCSTALWQDFERFEMTASSLVEPEQNIAQ